MARFAGVVALFTLLTAIMTWPQAARLATAAHGHDDVYFNMWRFAWVAHAMSTSPARVLDGNIFYPERRTLTFSDAMPLEAGIASPPLWIGLPPVLVHNIMLLAGIVLSAAGICMLARSLTGSFAAGVTAGVVFAFAPYRFEHYMHMELQWTVWIPWAFWAAHRTVETGTRRHGLLTGVFVALQVMSSIYYGIFLATLLALAIALLLCGLRRERFTNLAVSFALGGALAAAVALPYAAAYSTTRKEMGARSMDQVVTFSARPSSYTVATNGNFLYGARSMRRGHTERRLFPGILPVLLAIAGLLLRRPSNDTIVYLLSLVVAFELSLGLYGYSYTFLHAHAPIFDALRAPARLGIFVVFFLAVLAAYGHAVLEGSLSRTGKRLLGAAICGGLLLEYWVAPLTLQAYPNTPPPLYAWLARQPRGAVAEFPVPVPEGLPGDEARYAYMSTFHWMPLINGYSGYYPRSYIDRIDQLRAFPADPTPGVLRSAGVQYIIVHTSSYSTARAEAVLGTLSSNPALVELGRFDDGRAEAIVFRVR